MSFQPNFRSEVLLGGSRRLRKAFTAILIRQRNPIKTFGTDMSSELRKNAHRNMQFSLLPVVKLPSTSAMFCLRFSTPKVIELGRKSKNHAGKDRNI